MVRHVKGIEEDIIQSVRRKWTSKLSSAGLSRSLTRERLDREAIEDQEQ